MRRMPVRSESDDLPRSGSRCQFSFKSPVAVMSPVMGSTTRAAISVRADSSNFTGCSGEHFFSPFPKDLLGSRRFLCLLYVQARSTRWSSNTLNWSVKPAWWDALVLSSPLAALAGYFWPKFCWEETLKHYTVKCKHSNAMLRARFETHKIQDVL